MLSEINENKEENSNDLIVNEKGELVRSDEPKEILPTSNEITNLEKDLPKDDSLNYELLKPQEKVLVDQLVNKFELKDSESILFYGSNVQSKLAEFCDKILDAVKIKDVDDDVADILAELAIEIKHFDPEYEEKKGVLTNFFNSFNKGAKKVSDGSSSFGDQIKQQLELSKKETSKLRVKYENVSQTIDSIEKKLEVAKVDLIKNVTVMEQMYNNNLDYYKELSFYIIAGRKKLEQYEAVLLNQKQKALTSNDQMEIQKFNEMTDLRDKFDKKIDDLIRSRLISIQNAPQIRLVQRGSEQLIYQIQNSILTAIPVWKSQMVISLGISNNRTALGLQQHISDTTNQLLQKNSELLKQGAIEIAAESEKGLVSIETLKKTNENLITTIDTVMEIQKKGKEDRKIAQVEIQKLEEQLKESLLGKKNNAT